MGDAEGEAEVGDLVGVRVTGDAVGDRLTGDLVGVRVVGELVVVGLLVVGEMVVGEMEGPTLGEPDGAAVVIFFPFGVGDQVTGPSVGLIVGDVGD